MDLSSGTTILLLRIVVIVLLYLFLFSLVVVTQRELGAERGLRQANRPRGRLVVVDPGSSALPMGQAFGLEPVTRLGRAEDNVVVLDDEFVSAAHAMVVLRDGGWWVRDAGSTNGTLVNGRLVDGETPLREGDELQIGQVRLQLAS
ncbi:MAG: hypothetical protein QOF51_215 [Chloroflexota bacterium]|nr:hypothetical protein [Chloroflexota bacterium]